MHTEKNQHTKRSASKPGKSIVQRNVGKVKNGSTKTNTGADAISGIGLHNIAKHLRSISLFELAMLKGGDTKNWDDKLLLKTIDTEKKQLQCIEDLYAIVKAQPKYKKLNEPSWTIDTPPTVIIQWLLRKLGPLAKGDNWTVDTYEEPYTNKTRYRFLIYCPYHSQKVPAKELYMPLDFLPALKRRDLLLHDLIIDVVALISKCNKIPLWHEDGDYSAALKQISGLSFINHQFEKQMYSYIKGPAAQYLKVLIKRRKEVSIENVSTRIENYPTKSGRQNWIRWWLRRGVAVAQTGQNLTQQSYIPNYYKGDVLGPSRLYKFVWSIHDNDYVCMKAYALLKKADKNGMFLPVQFSVAKPGQLLKPIVKDRFPEDLCYFLEDGLKILLGSYREYFYKKQYSDVHTPSDKLIDIIALDEFKKSLKK